MPDNDLERRRIGQRVDPLTGEIYTVEVYNPDKPEPKAKQESEDDEEEEEEEAEEEEEGEVSCWFLRELLYVFHRCLNLMWE